MSDELNRQNPGGPAFKQAGVGHYCAFMCGMCERPKATAGSRKLRHKGRLQLLCKACATVKAGVAA